MKFCHMSMLRAEIEACRTGDFKNWKESNIVFFPCCFKSQTPIYKIPVERALKENFYVSWQKRLVTGNI